MTNRIEWKPSQLFGLLVLLLSMPVGCSGGDDGGGAGGSGGMSQGDIGMRPMTDGGVGDVVTPDCTADTDCADNEYCSSGVCNEGCRLTPTACADQDGVGRGCDPMTRTCVELVLCCSAGEGCADVLPADCPGQRCEADEGVPVLSGVTAPGYVLNLLSVLSRPTVSATGCAKRAYVARLVKRTPTVRARRSVGTASVWRSATQRRHVKMATSALIRAFVSLKPHAHRATIAMAACAKMDIVGRLAALTSPVRMVVAAQTRVFASSWRCVSPKRVPQESA